MYVTLKYDYYYYYATLYVQDHGDTEGMWRRLNKRVMVEDPPGVKRTIIYLHISCIVVVFVFVGSVVYGMVGIYTHTR